jgi:hypothetical protein
MIVGVRATPPKKPEPTETDVLVTRIKMIVVGLFFLLPGLFYEELTRKRMPWMDWTKPLFTIFGLVLVFTGIFYDDS